MAKGKGGAASDHTAKGKPTSGNLSTGENGTSARRELDGTGETVHELLKPEAERTSQRYPTSDADYDRLLREAIERANTTDGTPGSVRAGVGRLSWQLLEAFMWSYQRLRERQTLAEAFNPFVTTLVRVRDEIRRLDRVAPGTSLSVPDTMLRQRWREYEPAILEVEQHIVRGDKPDGPVNYLLERIRDEEFTDWPTKVADVKGLMQRPAVKRTRRFGELPEGFDVLIAFWKELKAKEKMRGGRATLTKLFADPRLSPELRAKEADFREWMRTNPRCLRNNDE